MLAFLRECTPGRTRRNIEHIVRLGTYSREMLQQLRRDIGLDYDQRTQGILHFYTSAERAARPPKAPPRRCAQLGCDRRLITVDEAVRIEPALRHIKPKLAGATYTAQDESGDANRFARELVEHCQADGVRFLMSHTVTALRAVGRQARRTSRPPTPKAASSSCTRMRTCSRWAAGARCTRATSGIRLPIYPAKGYSVTMPVRDRVASVPSVVDR